MAISNVPMPSFTLVLTSGHSSHRRHPTTIRFHTHSSASDRLMKTIDLRDESEDGYYTDLPATSTCQEDVDLPVTFKEAEFSGSIGKESEGHSIKANMLFFLHKFVKLALFKKIPSST